MVKGELFFLMKIMPEAARADLHEYLHSSFPSLSKLGLQLFRLMSPPKHMSDRRAIYQELWPGEAFTDQRLRRVAMELKTALRQFIAFQASRKRHWLEIEADFLRFLLDQAAYPAFQKAFRKAMRQLDQASVLESTQFFHLARIYQMKNEYTIHVGGVNDVFEEVSEAFDRHYLAAKLENRAAMLTREKRYSQQHRFSFEQEVDGMLASAPLQDWPMVRIWAKVQALESTQGRGGEYEALEDSLKIHAESLSLKKLRQVRGYQFNFLLRNLRSDQRDDYRELWLLAKQMETEGTLKMDGRLSAPFLRAAVRSACFAGEADWAADFLARNGADLVGPEKVQVLAIHHLMVAFGQGDFREVLRGSAILRHGAPRFEVLLRIVQLKAHFEMGHEEDFLRLAESFRKLMQRKKGLGQRFAEGYALFGSYAERLGKLRFLRGESGHSLEAEIRRSETGEKLWLLEKSTVH